MQQKEKVKEREREGRGRVNRHERANEHANEKEQEGGGGSGLCGGGDTPCSFPKQNAQNLAPGHSEGRERTHRKDR